MKVFKGFGLNTTTFGPMTAAGSPTTFAPQPSAIPDTFIARQVIQAAPFPSQTYATVQSKYSFPQVLAASPVPAKAVVAAPPQNIVVTLPTVEQRAYAPPAEVPPSAPPPAPRMITEDGPRPTTVSQPPTFEPGDPALHPMALAPVDPATGQSMASTAVEAPPTTTGVDPSNRGTIALAVGGLALVTGVWFFTR